jgi:hypothetical protein
MGSADEAVVLAFNAAINRRDLPGLGRLMADHHRFIEGVGDAGCVGWVVSGPSEGARAVREVWSQLVPVVGGTEGGLCPGCWCGSVSVVRAPGWGPRRGRDEMKYMIMTFGDTSALEGRSPGWIKAMIEFMQRIDVELTESGELVFQQGLADPGQARTVRVQQGVAVATDGPFAESRESLVGFWVVDVEDQARAVEIATRISQAADAPIEVRRCMDAPPDEVMEQLSR